jgi:hypothetical protein
MDLTRVESIILFLDSPPRLVTLYFENFRLE